jgi:Family of unknown function (DUF6169)
MDLQYNFTRHGNEFRFDTDNGIFYSVSFSDGSFYFFNLPLHIPVFEMSIKVVSFGNHLSPPRDRRVEITVVEIFRVFLSDNENSVVYVCDNLDEKQAARHRKFDMWFQRHASKDLEKHDTHFIVDTQEIYASLILHILNPFKQELIKVFLNQVNEYDKED